MRNMDSRDQVLRGKTMSLVKVLWSRSGGGNMGMRRHCACQLFFHI